MTNKILVKHYNEYKKWEPDKEPIVFYEKLEPNMTSDSSNGYTVTGPNALSSAQLWRLFDGTDNHYRTRDSTKYAKITLKLPEEIEIGKVKIIHYSTNQYLISILVHGSNDNENWELLVEKQTSNYNEASQDIIFESTAPYLYYSFEITVTGGSSYMYIREIELYEIVGRTEFIPAHWTTTLQSLPIEEQFLNEGMDDIRHLNKEILEKLSEEKLKFHVFRINS